VAAVLGAPGQPYTRNLVAAAPSLAASIAGGSG
jgi:hypothetical protein